jgi:hypothetical protein
MATKSLGAGYKIKIGKDGKAVVEKDRRAQLAKLDVSKRLQAEGAAAAKVKYKRGK